MCSAPVLPSPSTETAGSPHPPAADSRMPLVDLLKAVGAQLIALHHLAFYGPMSDWTHRLAPELVEWFSQHARMAVQVFLVVAGFLAARSLAPHGVATVSRPGHKLWQRYVRVGVPFLAALVVATLCAAVARQWMAHDSVPAAPSLVQWLAHATLLHTLLDVDSLSAGVWYVAIDLQLYAWLLGVVWLAKSRAAVLAWVLVGVAASVFFFNRDADWDAWALYFFGAYGMGALAYWFTAPGQGAQRALGWLALLATLVGAALVLDFRERLALALVVALCLGWAQHSRCLFTWPSNRWVAGLSRISYAVFLLNFPVALLVNAWFTRYAPAEAGAQTLGVLVAWGLANLAGAVFHTQVEVRLVRWVSGLRFAWRLWPARGLSR